MPSPDSDDIGSHLLSIVGALLLTVITPAAQAQTEAAEAPPSVEAQEADQGPPPSAEALLVFPSVEVELRCPRVICDCAEAPTVRRGALFFRASERCQVAQCRCVDEEAAAAQQPAPREPVLPAPALALPEQAYEPPPVFGFPLERHALGLRLEAGFPYLDVSLAVGLHDRVELGVGYRGLYFGTNAPYGSLRLRLYQTPRRSAAISLNLAAGYTFVQDGEGHDERTWLSVGDSVFGEVALLLSAGRYRHSFVAALGFRLSRVRRQPNIERADDYHYYYYSSSRIFENGEPGLLPSPFVEIGYAARVGRRVGLFLTTGITGYMLGDISSAMPRARAGLVFDFAPRSGR